MSSNLEVANTENCSNNLYFIVDKELRRHKKERGIERELTEKEVVKFLFGSYNDRAQTRLSILIREVPETTVVHRLNRMWAYPFTFILSPFRYILYGDIGWREETKLGKFILTCCGYRTDCK
ncbi:hypothetical protein [Photobacterium damselae]|uniref:hypothetical protein n=1 Tax=Photobacterium damselae TaxID=38293 RepID=UPI0040693762